MRNQDQYIEDIMYNAKTIWSDNGVSRDITYKQALQILCRWEQLDKESTRRTYVMSNEEYRRQIEESYNQREWQLNRTE